tara:strand:- start:7314 stop:7802 length:489 start_codon:yes stop_codon:yes gene_type:complete
MPSRKPLSKMPTDLRKLVLKARKQLAKDIVHSLTEDGPWWTGTFGENWVVSKTPVKPRRKRRPEYPYFVIPPREGRVFKNARVPTAKIGQDLYVGNRAKYAGFAINAPGQTLPNLKNKQVTYSEHAKEHKITAKGPNWYNVYTLGGLINKDINKAFKKVGFK